MVLTAGWIGEAGGERVQVSHTAIPVCAVWFGASLGDPCANRGDQRVAEAHRSPTIGAALSLTIEAKGNHLSGP